ncbi:hypothetical protein LP316_03410 [Thalassotalea sp. LPB0316]|uniref:hypothetical protein n=1 Tax=Thalassotalea sp. LPB0316 TaxID=2769490 RepID=UPI0018661C68|nr:hypothetical protein [Thalassotalea sp. LPB0316]QOL26366.1 hypothetical protein LP316_03410 [Thalassotalea sp. LPB0316]
MNFSKIIVIAIVLGTILFVVINGSENAEVSVDVNDSNKTPEQKFKYIDSNNDNVEATTASDIFTLSDYLEDFSYTDRALYEQMNARLFGVLNFKTMAEYEVLKSNGFPSIDDFQYVDNYNSQELSNQLYDEVNNYPDFSGGDGLSYQALSTLNLLQSLADLEETIRYYVPEYQQGDIFPRGSSWPDGVRPEQVTDQLTKIVSSYSVVMDASAFELLAQARYQQFAFNSRDNNAQRVVEKLAQANKLLKGNVNLENYVKANYADKIDYFYEISNK